MTYSKHLINKAKNSIQLLNRIFSKYQSHHVSKHLPKSFDQKKQDFDLELESLERRIEDLEEYRRKADFFIKKSLKKVIDDVYKRRSELDKKIQDYFLDLMEKITRDQDNKKIKFNQQVEKIDSFKIHVSKIEENLDDATKIEILNNNLGDVRSKSKLVETAIADLTREDFTFKCSDLAISQIFGEITENKHKKVFVEVDNSFFDNSLSENLSHQDDINDLEIIKENRVLSASKDGTVKLWDLETKKCLRKFIVFDHLNSIACLCVLHDGLLATGSFDRKIRLWNIDKGECIKSIIAHSDSITCLKLLKTGYLLSGSSDCTLKKWNQASGECLAIFRGHSNAINCIEETEDEKILSGSSDSQIRVWNQAGKCLGVLNGHEDYVLCIKILADGKIVSGSKDKTIKIWNIETGINDQTLVGHMEPVSCLWPLKNDQLISGSWDGTIKIWDLLSGTSVKTIKVHNDKINCLQVDHDGNILTGSSDKTVKMLHLVD